MTPRVEPLTQEDYEAILQRIEDHDTTVADANAIRALLDRLRTLEAGVDGLDRFYYGDEPLGVDGKLTGEGEIEL